MPRARAAARRGGDDAVPAAAPLLCLWCAEVLAPNGDQPFNDEELAWIRRHAEECSKSPAAKQRRIRYWQEEGYIPTSYSALSTFHDCPAQYSFALGDRDSGGDATRMGRVLHAYREHRRLDADNEMSLGQDPEFWKMVGSLDDYQTSDTMEFEKDVTYEVAVAVAGTEYIVQVRAKFDTYDVVDGWGLIDDFKTGQMLDYGHWEEQRTQYAIAAVRTDPRIYRGVKTRTIPLRYAGKEKAKSMRTELTLVEIERESLLLEGKLQAIAKAHHTNDFPARPETNRCRMCQYAHKCEAGQKRMAEFKWVLPIEIRQVKRRGKTVLEEVTRVGEFKVEFPAHLDTDESVKQFAVATFHLDKVLSDAKGVLKELARGKRIDVPEAGGAFAHWEQTSSRIRDAEAAIQRCIELGIDLGEVFNFNHQTGAKYIKDHEELQALVEEVPARYPKFGFRKLSGDEEDE